MLFKPHAMSLQKMLFLTNLLTIERRRAHDPNISSSIPTFDDLYAIDEMKEIFDNLPDTYDENLDMSVEDYRMFKSIKLNPKKMMDVFEIHQYLSTITINAKNTTKLITDKLYEMTAKIAKKDDEINDLKQQLAYLKEEFEIHKQFQPGGPGFEEAMERLKNKH